MSDLLTEKGWQKVLKEPKNLGLRVMGTGVSKKLRDCETMYGTFEKELKSKGKDYADLQIYSDSYLHGLSVLTTHLNNEIGKHKLFPAAMGYLKNVITEVKKREMEVKTRMKLEKEEWTKKGKEAEKLYVKHAPKFDELKKLFLAMNVALKKATQPNELTDKGQAYQKALVKISRNDEFRDLPQKVKSKFNILMSTNKPGNNFDTMKKVIGDTLLEIVAQLPKS